MAASEPVALSSLKGRTSPSPRTRREPRPWLKTGIFLGAVVPLLSMAWRASQGELQANAIAQIENELGLTALVFLIATLACTPARRFFNWTWQMPVRRELGLFAFFYALLHFLAYLVLDEFFDWVTIFADVIQRPFITVGFLALVLMVPLAVTSTSEWVRKLGFRKWHRLHQLTYVAGVLAIVHFIWRVKVDVSQPITYGVVLGILLLARLAFWIRARNKPSKSAMARTA